MILLKCFLEDAHFKRIRDPLDQEPAKTLEKIYPENLQQDWFLEFLGQGRELFRIYLVNFWLKLLTLGFYHPWAKARLFRYLYASTRLYDTDFQFHGNGRELFTGWVKALLALILLEGFHQIVAELIRQRGIDSEPGVGGGHEWYFWLDTANIVFYLLLFFLFFMIALVGVRRYRLSRTSWRGIRFRFDGTLVEISKLMIRGWAITLISLGLLYPLHRHRFQEYWVSRTRFGSSRFYYEGRPSELFPIWIRGFLLSLISFGVYSFWLRAGLQRYFWSRTRLEQAQLACNLHGWPLFRESMIYVFFLIFSCGFARPWADERYNRFYLSQFGFVQAPDLEAVIQAASVESGSTGEGVSSLLDLEF